MRIYTAIEGDVLDAVCLKTYPIKSDVDLQAVINLVLNANQGLSKIPIIPANTIIQLPDWKTTPKPVEQAVNLWG